QAPTCWEPSLSGKRNYRRLDSRFVRNVPVCGAGLPEFAFPIRQERSYCRGLLRRHEHLGSALASSHEVGSEEANHVVAAGKGIEPSGVDHRAGNLGFECGAK